MNDKQALLSELDSLVQLATEQTEFYKRSNEYLYKGLAGVYLWWLRARQVEGFLTEQYAQHDILGRSYGGEEKFTQVLRLVWRLDWSGPSKANLQQWSLALREIDKEYQTNTAAYKTEAQDKLVQFIDAQGGIRKLIGADKYFEANEPNAEQKSKRRIGRTEEEKLKLESKHLELGELYFASPSAPSISNIETTKTLAVNRKGYAIALIRQKADKTYDVLGSVNDEAQIARAIISTYKRSNQAAPSVLRLLTEVICTQSLPVALEKHRYTLADATKQKNSEGKPIRQNKRVLFRKGEGDVLFSENRTDCAVVTIAKPVHMPIASSEDVFLNVNDRRYIEQAIIQQQELSFYKTNDDNKIPVSRSGIAASHKLLVENKVTDKQHGLFFYKLSVVGETSRLQASLAHDYGIAPIWQATADRLWLEKLNVQFVGSWLREYGDHITRPKHKVMQFEFGKNGLVIKHYGENGNFSNASPIFDMATVAKTAKPIAPMFAAKDILPVLDGLMQVDMIGDMTLAVNADVLIISYKTELASYTLAVPTCTKVGKRNKAAFAAYGG